MAEITGDPGGTFTNAVRQLETEDYNHADTWNVENQKLITNDVLLKNTQDNQQAEIETARAGEATLDGRLGLIEANIDQIEVDTSIVQDHTVEISVLRKFGDEAITFEKMEDIEVFDVTGAVSGDDSIDLDDTSEVIVGQSYFIVEGAIQEQVKILSILTGTRVLATQNLTNDFTSAAEMRRFGLTEFITKEISQDYVFFLFADGSEDLTVTAEQDIGAGWTAITAKPNGSFMLVGPVRVKLTITAGTLDKVVLRQEKLWQDTVDDKQYVLSIESGTLIATEVV